MNNRNPRVSRFFIRRYSLQRYTHGIALVSLATLGVGVSTSAYAACPANSTPVQFAWENSFRVGAKWAYGDTSNVYTLNYTNGQGNADSVQVSVTMRDPHNMNVDPNVRDPSKHHYDPAGACKSSTGEVVDAWLGNGSFDDPWDSDCNGDPQKMSTGTGKAYGYPYFTWVLLSSNHEHEAYLDFKFSKPAFMDNFTVGDVDGTGLKWTYDNYINTESPGNSYQDEVGFSAAYAGNSVPVVLFNQGGGLVFDGNIARSRYDTNQNYNVAPGDPLGTLSAKTMEPFDTFTLMYSNGKDDADDEQANPQLYSWWSNIHGATNGASDNHAVRFSGFTFCVDETPKPPVVHSIGNRVWFDSNNNGKTDAGEQHAGTGVKLTLKDDKGAVLQDTTTDVNGRYLFHGLSAGSYQVCVTADNFTAGGKLEKYRSSTGQSGTEVSSDDGIDRGDDDLVDGSCSTILVLNDQEPTGEFGITDQPDGDDGQSTPDANSNLTVDFGFVPPTDLKLTKVADKTTVKPGDTVVYTLTVTNESDVAATGVEVTEQLPAGVEYVSDDSAGAYANATGIWTVGDLAKGESKILKITVTVQ